MNEQISSLKCTEESFMQRQKARSAFVNLRKTSFENRVIYFNDGFAKTDYFACKRLLEETARVFRDFPCLERITILIESSYEQYIYRSLTRRKSLEEFIGVEVAQLQDTETWRLFLSSVHKRDVVRFAISRILKYRIELEKPENKQL